jgi:D-serine deaminase-like pyridoxal phosphate-dependent protein
MNASLTSLPTPAVLIEEDRLRANIDRMQQACDAHGVQLWPHAKTHKCVEVARMQLDAGASGLTVAKMGEAEALLPSGVRRVFIAYPLVDPTTQAARLRALSERLEVLMVAATSAAQAGALGRVLDAADVTLPVLMAVDTGLGREGARGNTEAAALAAAIRSHPRMRLAGLFTHEGHAYRAGGDPADAARAAVDTLLAVHEPLGDPDLTLWPGCSVTAAITATLPGVHAVRPGSYVFGDISLARTTPRMDWDEVALSVLATVVDRPAPGLALIDAGSKTFSGDKTAAGHSAAAADNRDLCVSRVSEEHGFVTGDDADSLRIGDRLAFIPAHVCPVVNLADDLTVTRGGEVVGSWRVAARGKVR